MFTKFIFLIKNFFTKKMLSPVESNIVTIPSIPREILIDTLDYSGFDDPTIMLGKNSKKTLLIMDDIRESWLLYNVDINRIQKKYNIDLKNEFNIALAFGETAGFIAYKFIAITKHKVDYAILDMSLGYTLKLEDGNYLELDGIDIAIELIKHNPDIKFVISTVHTMNKRMPTLANYFNKFETVTGRKLMDHYLDKNGNRYLDIYNWIYGDKHETAS